MNLPLEISARRVITSRNKEILSLVFNICKVRNTKTLIKNLGKLALLGSYKIYLARNGPDWSPGGLMKP